MKTHQLLTNEGASPFAFEVERIYLPPAMAARLLADVDGVTDVEPRHRHPRSSHIHIEFQYRGQPHFVRQAYEDSSRYWIGPKDDVDDRGDVAAIEAAFKRYSPPLHRVLLGDVLMLGAIARLLKRNQ